MTEIRQALLKILDSQAFEQLNPFTEPSVWKKFPQAEKVLLARLLVMQGTDLLAKGDSRALDNFDAANEISSNASEILFQQALVLSSYRQNVRCLILASKVLVRLLEQAPSHLLAWCVHANVLIEIGKFENEPAYFVEASQCFQRIQALLEEDDQSICLEDDQSICLEEFYWKWGYCLSSLGKISGEPLDFYQSIEKYRKADQLGLQTGVFFNDFGHSLADLGALLDKQEYFSEALIYFHRAVLAAPQEYDGWFNQACCLQLLAQFNRDEEILFEEAEESFAKAADINPECADLWLKWGQLDIMVGKLKRDRQKFESGFAKFAKSHQIEPTHPHLLNSWAESELFLGAHEEMLDLIQSAQIKILRSLQMHSEDPHTWYLCGSSLNELGRYFNNQEYYHQAIEKFRYGLSLTNQYPLLWYGLALAHLDLGEMTHEQALFEKAVKYFSKVNVSGENFFPQFWNDWGVALLKLAEMTQEVLHVQMAIDKFERTLKFFNQNPEEEEYDLEWIYNYGCALDLLGDFTEEPQHLEKAVQVFTQILQLDGNYQLARYNLALAFTHLGEALSDVDYYQKAIEQFQILLEQDSEEDVIHLDFGMALTSLAILTHDEHHPERSQTLFFQAENHLMQAAALGNTQSFYQLAGLYSLTSHYPQAMHYLERAQASETLPGIEDLLHDEWLEGVRKTPSFRQFISQLSSRHTSEDK